MKHLLSFVCLLFLCLSAGAQIAMGDLARKTLHFAKPAAPGSSGLFRHFEVIDERPDTGRIGIYLIQGVLKPSDRQYVFKKPAAAEIAEYFNQYFTRPDAPCTALIVLRTLWLSNANYAGEDELKTPDKQYEQIHIRLKAEIYATRDSLYTPELRYDTAWTMKTHDYYSSLHASYFGLDDTLSSLFINLADSASWVTGQKQNSGRLISREQINEFNRSRFDKPAGSEGPYASGVYTSFEEFRNNTPSIRDFEIRTEKMNRLLYIKDASGAPYYSHTAWGYSDGTSLFIMHDGILWPVWKEGKAFYFFALSDKNKHSHQSYDAYGQAHAYKPEGSQEKETCIYTLDLDTGEVY
jgi:hypothetical protein